MTGSEKQIKWANDIIANIDKQIADFTPATEKQSHQKEVAVHNWNFIKQYTNAKFIIEKMRFIELGTHMGITLRKLAIDMMLPFKSNTDLDERPENWQSLLMK